MAVTQTNDIAAPQRTARTGGLLDNATVIDVPNIGILQQSGLWESWGCINPVLQRAVDMCAVGANPKVFGSPTWVSGAFVSVYAGEDCKLVGSDYAGAPARLSEGFTLSESRALEQALIQSVLTAAGNTTDTIGATAFAIDDAIAQLDSYASANYVGQATIHMPYLVAAKAKSANVLPDEDNVWITPGQNKVSRGGGYDYGVDPSGDPTDTGEIMMYMTGEVVILRGPATAAQTVLINNEDEDDSNIGRAFMERSYLIAIDCMAVGILTNIASGLQAPALPELPEVV